MKPYKMQIDCISSGQEAIDAIRDETVLYNAVFMDHMMPDMDGIEATKRIRELGTKYAKSIPIIALTANAISGSEEMFLSKGFQAYISKPVETAQLDNVIRQWVRNKEKEKELEADGIDVNEETLPDASSSKSRRNSEDRHNGLDRKVWGDLSNSLNIDKGIRCFGDDKDAYLGVLRSFAENTKPLLEQIKGVQPGQLAQYGTIVHGIKGSSRGVYAEDIGDWAEALEKAAKEGDYLYISNQNGSFVQFVEKFINDLTIKLDEIAAEQVKLSSNKPDTVLLARLLVACELYDMDGAEAVINDLERYEYESNGSLVTRIRGCLDEADFEQIIRELQAYKELGE